MPNHVRNILTITGNASELERFKNLMCSDTNPALKEHLKKCLENQIDLSKKKGGHWGDHDLKEAEEALASLDKFQTIFSFDATVPFPPELRGTTSPPQSKEEKKLQKKLVKKYGAGNWYEWERINWGVKWGAYSMSDEWREVDDGIGIDFDTAWSPPMVWLQKTARLFPSLTFKDAWHSEGGETGVLTVCVDEGIEDNENLEEHEWLLENDGVYRDEYEIVTQDYKQMIKDVLEANEEFNYYQNEKRFLDRLKPQDLPLFINFAWRDRDDFEKKFKSI